MPDFMVQSFGFFSGCPKVGSPCRRLVWIVVKVMCNETTGEFGFGFRGEYKKEHFFHRLLSFHNISFSTSVNVSFDKLEATMSVTSAYQGHAGLNILSVENLVSC